MAAPKEAFHGSDLEKIEEYYHIKKEEIVSFSANVNPLGISSLLRETLASHLDAITTYPDRDYVALRKAISQYTGAELSHIIVGNGSTELISLFIKIRQAKKALIIGPSYSEYEREISLEGGSSLYHRLSEEHDFNLNLSRLEPKLNESVDLLVICNPNNPTSSAIPRKQMRQILDVCKQQDIFVIIDETYVEFAPDVDEITAVPLTNYYNNVAILRGISKFFASPGLRLGYAICGNPDIIREINKKKNPWTINSLAAIAGEIMFSDTEYIQRTRSLILSERQRIKDILSTWKSVKVYEPYANFILVRILNPEITSDQMFDYCIRQKMMIRDCSTFPFLNHEYIRFCFMKPEDNNRLLRAMAEYLGEEVTF
ncbi:MAG: histidinol-phosphate transaminase [Lachnospiraceae bacterium]|nr:histidinol-phosphate transaminase [Lachnospiraceae bacterium]